MRESSGDNPPDQDGLAGPLNRDHPLPLHGQLRHAISEMISRRALRRGDLLPSEPQLCEDFGVSRTVVRQALAELENEGMVRRVKGKGTFVGHPKTSERLVHTLMGLYEDVQERGGEVRSEVLQRERVPASAEIAEKLDVEVGTDVVFLRRMRFVDEEPWALSVAWLPEAAGVHTFSADMTRVSLYQLLERHGFLGATGWRSVEAVLADNESAIHLQLPVGSPLLKLKSVRRDDRGVPIEYFEALHRGDHSRFEFELTQDETLARVLTHAPQNNGC